MPTLLVHDTRLAGQTPGHIASFAQRVDGNTLVRSMVNNVVGYADTFGSAIDTLMIMCHGYESSDTGRASIPQSLGFGLHLCREGVTLANGSVMAGMSGYVNNIVLYACGPANTHPFASNTRGDGRRFCMEMAAYTNANVFASDATQYYHNLNYDDAARVCEEIPIDFGGWEGHVYQFCPDGNIYVVQ